MPATILRQNDFSGLADGTGITTANSGGSSGDALTVTTTTSTVTAQTVNGRKCAEIVMAATGTATHLQWLGLGSLTSDVYFRFYFDKGSTDVAANWFDVMRGLDSAATRAFNLGVFATNDVIRVANAADTEDTTARGTVTIPASSWVRIEARVTPSTTAGVIEWKMWTTDPEGTGTPNDTDTTTTATALLATLDGARWGVTSTPTNQNSRTFRLAQLAIGTGDWIGPAVTIPPITDAPETLRVVRSAQRWT